mmetsp:Transcript_31128/g.49901  ORF Transcript_31128/g.49901 Transcript_31128/m.49901 type:complete len:114 (-) Transcript_31128:168-509(-)
MGVVVVMVGLKGSLRLLSWLWCGWALEMEGGAVRWNGMSVDGFDGVKESVCMKRSLRFLSWLGCGWALEMKGMEWNERCGGVGLDGSLRSLSWLGYGLDLRMECEYVDAGSSR